MAMVVCSASDESRASFSEGLKDTTRTHFFPSDMCASKYRLLDVLLVFTGESCVITPWTFAFLVSEMSDTLYSSMVLFSPMAAIVPTERA